jgi:hypothetical protein
MATNAEIFERELLGSPTEVMQQYLTYFKEDANTFVNGLHETTNIWDQYANMAVKRENQQEELMWSAAYFFNAINSTLVSTRLFLSGYIAPSGNLARQALESLAFAVLLAFQNTGTYREWKKGHASEHKALGRLARNAKHCGVNVDNTRELDRQAKWFDQYSHPSRLALATIWMPSCQEYPEGGWNVGALFVEQHLEQYRKEMVNRVSLAGLLTNTIAGTHAELIKRGMIGHQAT